MKFLCYCGTLIVVFTMVTEAFKESALPFNTVCTELPAVEKVTPAEAIIVPLIMPPPAPLIVAALPTYQYTFFARPPFFILTLRAPDGPATPTVKPLAVWNIHCAFGSPLASSVRSPLVILKVPLADLYTPGASVNPPSSPAPGSVPPGFEAGEILLYAMVASDKAFVA